jgi:hypothetical protein
MQMNGDVRRFPLRSVVTGAGCAHELCGIMRYKCAICQCIFLIYAIIQTVPKYISREMSLCGGAVCNNHAWCVREVAMLDNEKQELRRDTLIRVLAPLNRRNHKRSEMLALSLTCLFAEIPIFVLSVMMFYCLLYVLHLHSVPVLLGDLYICILLSFFITGPHIIAAFVSVSLKKKIC